MSRNDTGRVLSIEPSNDGSYVRFADGRTMGDVNIVADDTLIERIRTGWTCIRCYEPQSEAFPPVCEMRAPNGARVCNFPIRDMQADEFRKLYDSESVHVGSRVNISDELERLQQIDKFERKTGIKLPPGTGL